MQVLSSCVQARQGFMAPCRATLEVLSSVPFWSPAAPLSSVPPASNADPFNPVCYLLSICRSFPASDLRSCVRLLQKMFAHTLQQLRQQFQVTLERWAQHRNCAGSGRGEPGKQIWKVLRWVQHCGAHRRWPRWGVSIQSSQQTQWELIKVWPSFWGSHKGLSSPANSSRFARAASPHPAQAFLSRHPSHATLPPQTHPQHGSTRLQKALHGPAERPVQPCHRGSRPACLCLLPGSVSCRSVNHILLQFPFAFCFSSLYFIFKQSLHSSLAHHVNWGN